MEINGYEIKKFSGPKGKKVTVTASSSHHLNYDPNIWKITFVDEIEGKIEFERID